MARRGPAAVWGKFALHQHYPMRKTKLISFPTRELSGAHNEKREEKS